MTSQTTNEQLPFLGETAVIVFQAAQNMLTAHDEANALRASHAEMLAALVAICDHSDEAGKSLGITRSPRLEPLYQQCRAAIARATGVVPEHSTCGQRHPVGTPCATPQPPIRYDLLSEYADKHRLDYNDLCRVVREAASGVQRAPGVSEKRMLELWHEADAAEHGDGCEMVLHFGHALLKEVATNAGAAA